MEELATQTITVNEPHRVLSAQLTVQTVDLPKLSACSVGPYQQGTDKCAIPIVHNTTVPFVYAEYLTWSQGDDYLDFEGAELNQGELPNHLFGCNELPHVHYAFSFVRLLRTFRNSPSKHHALRLSRIWLFLRLPSTLASKLVDQKSTATVLLLAYCWYLYIT